jgi:hypothetical protein
VGVAVVDDEGLVEPLGEVDVAAERLLLHRPALLAGAVEVQAGLPHGPHPGVRGGQRLDLGHRVVERRQPRSLVGVQGDAGDQGVVRRGRLDRPPGAGQVAPDLHDPGDADGGRERQGLPHRHGRLVATRDVEVAVVVDDRVRQWLRDRRTAHPRTRARIASAHASAAWVGIQWLTPSSTTSS